MTNCHGLKLEAPNGKQFLTPTNRRIRYNTSMESLFADIKDNIFTDVVIGDSKKVLQKIQDNRVDLVVTSPPYA